MTVTFFGNTAITRLGRVDMVPLNRRLEGDLDSPVQDFERDGGILALQARGVPLWQICKVFDMSSESVSKVLAGKQKRAKTLKQSRSDKYDRDRAKVLQRHAERERIDGRWVHPDCEHGKDKSYRHFGCRCIPCSAAHTIVRRKSYARKKAAA